MAGHNTTENDLIAHYDNHPDYYSPMPANYAWLVDAFDLKPHPKRVLDLGCGDGRLLHYLAANYNIRRSLGVDYSSVRIAKANRKMSLGVRFECTTIQDFLNRGVSRVYDICYMFEVLEHLAAPLAILEQIKTPVVVGSVPVNAPYVAHLQVYPDIAAVKIGLLPDQVIQKGNHFYCKWVLGT